MTPTEAREQVYLAVYVHAYLGQPNDVLASEAAERAMLMARAAADEFEPYIDAGAGWIATAAPEPLLPPPVSGPADALAGTYFPEPEPDGPVTSSGPTP